MDFWSWAADVLLDMDERLLLLLNGVHTHCLDYVMWMMSNRWVWVPLYILLIILLFRKFSLRSDVMVTVMLVILITLTDQTCAAVIRPAVCRLRPHLRTMGFPRLCCWSTATVAVCMDFRPVMRQIHSLLRCLCHYCLKTDVSQF